MEQLTNGGHSSSNHLFYSLQQQQQSEIFLSNSYNNSCYPTAMDMTVLDRQRSRLNALELNWQQRQHRGLDTNSEQMHGSFSNLSRSSEMFTNGTITSDWQQFQSQKGPLMPANVIGAENSSILSDGSALRDIICRSLPSAIPPQQQHRLTSVPNIENGWPDLSSNEDNNNVRMIKVDGSAGSSVPTTAPACFAPFSSDPGFAERAAKFSSFNNTSARVTSCQRVATEESAPSTGGSNDSETSKTICITTSRTAQLEDGTGDVQKFSNFTEDSALSEKKSVGDTKFANENVAKRRKTDRSHGANLQNTKGTASEEIKEKRSKMVDLGKEKEDSKAKGERSNSDNTVESSPTVVKENSKVSETPKQDYIHVRARRGQATDSHSLAERVRREKISERMKYLQDLVPGCNKITGKAVMLDEIINYVQSLQRQVEFLSMKLATVNPRLDFNIDNILAKEVVPPCGNFAPMEVCPDLTHSSYLQFHQLQQASLKTAACCELDVPSSLVSSAETSSLHRTSAPVSAELFIDTNFQGHGHWDGGLQNAFDIVQGGESPFASQGLPGHLEVNPMKMEM